MRLVFLGPPGVGKGTQARRLADVRRIPHIATGDMLREAIKSMSSAGLRAQTLMNQGSLVPDGLVIEIIEERFQKRDVAAGFILDGFPRTLPQAEALDDLLAKRREKLERVLYFDAPDDLLVRRISGRRICRNCQSPHHVEFAPPKTADVCDSCGGPLYQRPDDREETVRNRLVVYRAQTTELIPYYTRASILIRIDASAPPDEVTVRMNNALR